MSAAGDRRHVVDRAASPVTLLPPRQTTHYEEGDDCDIRSPHFDGYSLNYDAEERAHVASFPVRYSKSAQGGSGSASCSRGSTAAPSPSFDLPRFSAYSGHSRESDAPAFSHVFARDGSGDGFGGKVALPSPESFGAPSHCSRGPVDSQGAYLSSLGIGAPPEGAFERLAEVERKRAAEQRSVDLALERWVRSADPGPDLM